MPKIGDTYFAPVITPLVCITNIFLLWIILISIHTCFSIPFSKKAKLKQKNTLNPTFLQLTPHFLFPSPANFLF